MGQEEEEQQEEEEERKVVAGQLQALRKPGLTSKISARGFWNPSVLDGVQGRGLTNVGVREEI